MIDKKERSVAAVLEDVSFILNEVRNTKFKNLEETKLSAKQEKILEEKYGAPYSEYKKSVKF